MAGVLTAIFFGGWYLPFGNEALERGARWPELAPRGRVGTIFWLKVLLLIYLQLVIRWTFPRFRYDQVQKLGWKILLPMGLVNLFVSGALVLWDPSLQAAGWRSACSQLLVIVFLTLTPPRQVAQRPTSTKPPTTPATPPHPAHAAADTH